MRRPFAVASGVKVVQFKVFLFYREGQEIFTVEILTCAPTYYHFLVESFDCFGLMILLHIRPHSDVEFSGGITFDGLVSSRGFMSIIGDLFPIELCGLTSL